jgi:hypothetical protein
MLVAKKKSGACWLKRSIKIFHECGDNKYTESDILTEFKTNFRWIIETRKFSKPKLQAVSNGLYEHKLRDQK